MGWPLPKSCATSWPTGSRAVVRGEAVFFIRWLWLGDGWRFRGRLTGCRSVGRALPVCTGRGSNARKPVDTRMGALENCRDGTAPTLSVPPTHFVSMGEEICRTGLRQVLGSLDWCLVGMPQD